MGLPGVIVARTDSNDATAIDSVEDERDHPFIYGATNRRIVPFKNVSLAVIKKFYEHGFKEINGHLLHRISDKAYREAEQWLKEERLTSRVNDSLERIDGEIQSLKKLRQQARRQKKGHRDVREQLSALEVMVKKVTEETVDHVLADIREAWAQRAGLKTYAQAVAQAMQAKTPGKANVERWKSLPTRSPTRKLVSVPSRWGSTSSGIGISRERRKGFMRLPAGAIWRPRGGWRWPHSPI